jgi:uncharacterized protein HemX
MVVVGLLLMLACAALAADAVVQNHGAAHAVAFSQHVAGLSLGALFVAGAVLGLLFALGLAMFTGGVGRAARIRRERRALRRENADAEALRAENNRLEQRLAQHQAAAEAYPQDGDTEATTATGTTSRGRHRQAT